MTTSDYLEKIDDTLAHWEDYFHGQEGTDVTEARANLDKVRKQLILSGVTKRSELVCTHNFSEPYTQMGGGLTLHECIVCGIVQTCG